MLTKNDLNQIRSIVKQEADISIKREINPLKTKINKIDKKLDTTIKLFDSDIVDHAKRIDRLEKHLDLSSASS